MSTLPVLDDDDYHRIFVAIHQNIAREDSNTGQRVTWAIALSAGLITAIAFLAPRANDTASGAYWTAIVWITVSVIAGLGMFVSMKSWRGVRAAHRQIDYLRSRYEADVCHYDRLNLPRPFGDPTEKWGIESADIFPRTLMVFWFIVLSAALIASVISLARAAVGPVGLPSIVKQDAIGTATRGRDVPRTTGSIK